MQSLRRTWRGWGGTGLERRWAPLRGSAFVLVSGVSGRPFWEPEARPRDRIGMGSRHRECARRIDGDRLTPQGLMDIHAVIDHIDGDPHEGEQVGGRRDGQYRRGPDLSIRVGMAFRSVANRGEDNQHGSGHANGAAADEKRERRAKKRFAQHTDQPVTPIWETSVQQRSRRGRGRKRVHRTDSGAAPAKSQSPATFCQACRRTSHSQIMPCRTLQHGRSTIRRLRCRNPTPRSPHGPAG